MSDFKGTLAGQGPLNFGTQTAAGTYNPVGFGSVFDMGSVFSTWVLQTTGTALTAVSVKLQGSMTGGAGATEWYDLCASTSTTGDANFATGKPARFVRLNLVSITGTSVTATAGAGPV